MSNHSSHKTTHDQAPGDAIQLDRRNLLLTGGSLAVATALPTAVGAAGGVGRRAAHEFVARCRNDPVPQREGYQLGRRLPRAGDGALARACRTGKRVERDLFGDQIMERLQQPTNN